jgi:radical SAM superfamily enzyme YgiQ (UPF0313 family)
MAKHRTKERGGFHPLAREHGTIRKEAPLRVALGYPAPYAVGASSLGFQTVHRLLNEAPGVSCGRFFLERDDRAGLPLTVEDRRPVADARAVAFSAACETDLLGIVDRLVAMGLAPLAAERGRADPPVIVGGSLTVLDPRLVAPLSDVVVVGDGEPGLPALVEALGAARDREDLAILLAARPPAEGLWVPASGAAPPPPARAADAELPAVASTWSPDAELRELFLVEAARGCARGCAFCVMSGRAAGASGFRPVPAEAILAAVPAQAPGVGLVGAAVTDHPDLVGIVERLVDLGKRVSLSSIRADRLDRDLASALARGGLRSLTLAADGCSERLRRAVHKGISAAHLIDAARIAADAGVGRLKLYSMVGLPDEEDADVDEFAALVRGLDPRLALSVAVQAFVPKPGTPLAGEPMADPRLLVRRLDRLGLALKGRARLLPTSPRWSWVDWKLAHAGERAARAAIAAHAAGGTLAAWRAALADQP